MRIRMVPGDKDGPRASSRGAACGGLGMVHAWFRVCFGQFMWQMRGKRVLDVADTILMGLGVLFLIQIQFLNL